MASELLGEWVEERSLELVLSQAFSQIVKKIKELEKEQCESVTESKLIPLAARQANKWGSELLGQGKTTLFRKSADREAGRLVSCRATLPTLEIRLLLC